MNVILSIHPKWAKLIYEGKKTIEWRKSFPKNENLNTVFIYETAPVKKITGYFLFNNNILLQSKCYLVSSVLSQSELIINMGCVPITDLIKYKGNSDIIYGWLIGEFEKFKDPLELSHYGLKRPPQSWCYTKALGL